MKNLRKALAAVIALTVMSVSASAFAEISATGAFSGGNGAVTANYDNIASNTVVATVDTAKAALNTQMTFLILDDGTDVTNIAESDILYIDQKELTAGSNSFTGVINLARVSGAAEGATELPAGEYPIRVGYYYDDNGTQAFGLAVATMVVTAGSEGTTIEIIWGDITGDALIDSEDALAALFKLAGVAQSFTVSGNTATVGEEFAGYLWGDLTGDALIDSEDALAALFKLAGVAQSFTVNGESVTVGDTVQGTIVE